MSTMQLLFFPDATNRQRHVSDLRRVARALEVDKIVHPVRDVTERKRASVDGSQEEGVSPAE